VPSCLKRLSHIICVINVKQHGAQDDLHLKKVIMVSRLRKEINCFRRKAYLKAVKKWKKDNSNDNEVATCDDASSHGNLPRPSRVVTKINPSRKPGPTSYSSPPSLYSDHMIKSPAEWNSNEEDYRMMHKHHLWIRMFDKYNNLLFNHAHPQPIHTSQMIQICTKLVKHMNLISQTAELEIQKALGTFEGTIIAQLTLPFDVNYQHSSWNDQDPDKNRVSHSIGAIAIIAQEENDTFKGQLIDDYVGTTFQI